MTPEGNLLPFSGFVVTLVMILCEEEAFLRNRIFYNICFALCWALDIYLLL